MKKHAITVAAFLLILTAPAGANPKLDKALCDAAYKGTPAKIAAAVKKGANVNQICAGWGNTPLAVAALQGSGPRVDALLSAGASVNEIDDSKDTALMLSHSAAVTRTLLAHSADATMRDKYGQTALINAGSIADDATEQDNIDMVQMLLDKGLNINDQANNTRSTVLLEAVNTTHTKFITWLLDHGADPNLRNESNQTALSNLRNGIRLGLVQDQDLPATHEIEQILIAHGGVE